MNKFAKAAAPKRLLFIDALRAFAILMMLQGHFISATLADEFHRPDHWLYAGWEFMRGLTAPVFFTSTGLVFCYLLLGETKADQIFRHKRWRKGIRRGLFLIALGYSLRLNVLTLISLDFRPWMFYTDVLHCIGLALLFVCGTFALGRQRAAGTATLLGISGIIVFFSAPLLNNVDLQGIALPLRHFVNQQHGAIFSPLPWLGYTCFGGVLGTLLRLRPKLGFSPIFPAALLVFGWLIATFSSGWWMDLHRLTELELFKSVAYSNTFYMRLGHTLILVGLFVLLTRRLARLPRWIMKTGGETLTIYAAHYVVLYGAWFGLGLNRYLIDELNPILATIGALAFVVAGVVLATQLDWIRNNKWYYRLTNLPTRISAPLR
ncbi:hypothetical protein CEQ90_04100 [Lewinellaceae bacterium SD302]|nr:hypothetical protein CEQ90_04100 [Lewinellaceae bacterium SD302]